jgi:7,8-dihydro-6-hydroxymethylpterin-pyrophosphokinase
MIVLLSDRTHVIMHARTFTLVPLTSSMKRKVVPLETNAVSSYWLVINRIMIALVSRRLH